MAYKFQRGEAILSGALLQEGSIEIESGFEFSMHDETVLDTSRNLTVAGMSGSGALQAGGAMTIAGNSDLNGTLDVAGDTKLAASGVGTQIRGDLTVDELAEFNGGATFNTAIVEDLTPGLIVLAGTGGEIEDSANLAFDGSQLSVTGVISGSSDLEIGGTVRLDGVADEALDVSAHSFYYRDSSGLVKRDAMSDYADAIAGDGLAAASGVLSVGVHGNGGIEISSDELQLNIAGMDDLGGASIDQADEFAMSDAGTVKKVNFSDFEDSIFANISGQAAVAAGGALSLDVSAITAQTEMTGDVADADELMISDGGVLKRLDFSVLRDAVFADVSGDATVAAGGALTIAADSVEGTMLNTNAADGTTMELSSDSLSVLKVPNALSQGEGIAAFEFDGSSALTVGLSASVAGAGLTYSSGVLAVVNATNGGLFVDADAISLSLDDLAAADIDVAADSFAIYDASASGTRKESIADLVSAMAGEGLTATDGVLKVTGNDVHSKADGDTLQEGYNYFADASADADVTLPASPAVGDVVHVKAADLTNDAVIAISKGSADHRIDGEEVIVLESPFAAVSLVYVAANAWRIV